LDLASQSAFAATLFPMHHEAKASRLIPRYLAAFPFALSDSMTTMLLRDLAGHKVRDGLKISRKRERFRS